MFIGVSLKSSGIEVFTIVREMVFCSVSLKLREQVTVKWENGLRGMVLRGEGEGGGETQDLPEEWEEHRCSRWTWA